jgi:hypothetical protein
MKIKDIIIESKTVKLEPQRPRNFVAKNAMKVTSGAGAHKDKKRADKQGDVKHKKQMMPMESYGQRQFEVNGYVYMTEIEEEEDNRKIWHMLKTPEGKTIDVDFTPYSYMSKNDVELYIKLGMPQRQGPGPLDREKLQKMAQIKGIAMLDPKMARAGMEDQVQEEPASRALCTSGKPDSALGASQLASCKSQGYRSRDGGKSHKVGSDRVKVRGKKIKGKKYGGPLPDWS